MIFDQLVLENFGIFRGRNKIELNFTNESDSAQNIILIGGMNGRGKTTFLEAVLLVLYGRYSIAFKETGLNYTQYLRKFTNTSSGNTKAAIELDFSVVSQGQTVSVRVRRAWDASQVRIFEQIDVWADGLHDPHLGQYWDLYIEEILPAGIAGLFFFDGEKVSSLAENLSNVHTKKAIDALLGIDIIERLLADITRIINRTKDRLTNSEILDRSKDSESKRDAILKNLAENHQTRRELGQELSLLVNYLAETEELFVKEGGALEQSLDDLKKHKASLQEEFFASRAFLHQLASGPLPLTLVEDLLKEIDVQARAEQAATRASHLSSYVDELAERLAEQIETPDYGIKEELNRFFQSEKNKLGLAIIEKPIFDFSPAAHEQLVMLLNGAHKSKKDLMQVEIEKVGYLKEKMNRFNEFLAKERDADQISDRLQEIKHLTSRIVLLEAELKDIEDVIQVQERELEIAEADLRKLLDEILLNENEQADARRIISYSLKTIDTMTIFKSQLAKAKVKALGEEIFDCFQILIDKATLVQSIKLDPETYELHLTSGNGKQLLTSQLSAGERQMLAVSVLWGLARASGHKMPVIIDTPMARLDSSHRTNYVKHYLPHASHQLIALSTDEEIVDEYLESLEASVSHKYLLSYNEDTSSTTVVNGYFEGDKL